MADAANPLDNTETAKFVYQFPDQPGLTPVDQNSDRGRALAALAELRSIQSGNSVDYENEKGEMIKVRIKFEAFVEDKFNYMIGDYRITGLSFNPSGEKIFSNDGSNNLFYHHLAIELTSLRDERIIRDLVTFLDLDRNTLIIKDIGMLSPEG